MADKKKRDEDEKKKQFSPEPAAVIPPPIQITDSQRQPSAVSQEEIDSEMEGTPEPSEEKAGVTSKFMNGLGAFLPMLAGLAIAGPEGGAAAGKGFLDTSMALEELRLKQQAADRVPAATNVFSVDPNIVDKDTGEIVRFHKPSGKFLRGDNTESKSQINTVDTRFNKRLDLTKQEKAQLTPTQTKSIADLDKVSKNLEQIRSISPQVTTGPVSSRVQSLLELAGQAPKKFTELKSRSASLVADYIRSVSGAQASEAEVSRLNSVAPNINDEKDVFSSKLASFSAMIEESREAILESIKSGQPLKAGTIDALIDKYELDGRKSETSVESAEETPRQRLERLRKKHGR